MSDTASTPSQESDPWPAWRSIALSVGLYAVVALVAWWGIWSTHPSNVTVCACGDVARYVWFLEWPAWALTHGASLFHASAAFPPGGVNLLDDTSVLAFGVPLIPVTWAFGPIASENVALFLVPVLSATGMLLLLRRWVRWMPVAFIGGLVYGFSLYVFNGLADGWLNFLIAIPPLIVLCLDELLDLEGRSEVKVGVVLGVLIIVQFFASTELLAITAMMVTVGMLLVVLDQFVSHRYEFAARAHRFARGAGTGVLVAGVVLAYPLWFIFAGPAHLTGLVWPEASPGWYGVTLSGFVHLFEVTASTKATHRFGGYQGDALAQLQYLGWPMVAVLLVGLALCWRSRRMWLLAAVGALGAWCCLTPFMGLNPFWVPWSVLAKIPVIQNILPIRFAAVVLFASVAMLAIATTRLRALLIGALPNASLGRLASRMIAGSAALTVLGVAFVPQVSLLWSRFPLTTTPTVLPEWFATTGKHLPPGEVVLTYPVVFGGLQAPLAWQAVDRMSFTIVGGDGPRSDLSRAGAERPGFTVLASTTIAGDPATWLTSRSVAKVRSALSGWGATIAVEPDQAELPIYERGDHPVEFALLMTAATGRAPVIEHRAWVWRIPQQLERLSAASTEKMTSCRSEATIAAATSCVLR
jgi:hypothetical protein